MSDNQVMVTDPVLAIAAVEKIKISTFTAIQSILAWTTAEGILAGFPPKAVLARSTLQPIITATACQHVVAVSTTQVVIERCAIEMVMAIEPVDAMGYILVATQHVITGRRSTDQEPIQQLRMAPELAIGKSELLDAMGGGEEIIAYA